MNPEITRANRPPGAYADCPWCEAFLAVDPGDREWTNAAAEEHSLTTHGKRWRPIAPKRLDFVAMLPQVPGVLRTIMIDKAGELWQLVMPDLSWQWVPFLEQTE